MATGEEYVIQVGKSDLHHQQSSNLRSAKSFAHGGMRITIKDLCFSVPHMHNKKEKIFLLKNVSGFFQPREMTALMGPSGSGKTTLLDILAGRKNTGDVSGQILYSGHTPSSMFLRRYTGYVEQFDTLIPMLTVKEMLMYTAELKRPIDESRSSKEAAVLSLLGKLNLTQCKDVKIGSASAKGISGGQAKRTNIGIALITNPKVLFLDEPTSGLDSYTSNEVMSVVRTFLEDNVTICATIHSPTSYCFSLFDSLMMLVRGEIVYFGSRGHETIEFAMSACPDVKEYTAGYNDAEWLVDMVTEADTKGRGGDFAKFYANSPLKLKNDKLISEYLTESDMLPDATQKQLQVKRETVTPWWWALATLVKYRTIKNWANPEFLGPRVFDKVLISLLILTLYLGIGDNFSPDNVINISAVLFMWAVMPAFGAAAYVPALVMERNLFTRERNDGLYYVITYLLGKLVDELVPALLATLPISAWVFAGIQLQGEWVLFWVVYFVNLSNGIMLAYFVASWAPNMDVANAALPLYVVTLLFFAGFLFRLREIPPWWKWYSYIDFIKYAWGALMINQFENNDPKFLGASTALEVYGMHLANKWTYCGYASLFFIVFFLGAWFCMSKIKYSKR